MRRPGFEPGFWAWKAQVIATRPSTQTATHLGYLLNIMFSLDTPYFLTHFCITEISIFFLSRNFSAFMKSSRLALVFSSLIIGRPDGSVDMVNSIPNVRKWSSGFLPCVMQGCNWHATGKKTLVAMLNSENRLSIQT